MGYGLGFSGSPHTDPLFVELTINNFEFTTVLIDTSTSFDLTFKETLIKMEIDFQEMIPSTTFVTDFNGYSEEMLATIRWNVFVGEITNVIKFSVIGTPAPTIQSWHIVDPLTDLFPIIDVLSSLLEIKQGDIHSQRRPKSREKSLNFLNEAS